MDGEDVRVGERGKRLGLAFKASESFGIACKGLGLDFHGDLAPEARIASAIHLPHAACAERSNNFVRPKPARDYEHARRLLLLPHEGSTSILPPNILYTDLILMGVDFTNQSGAR